MSNPKHEYDQKGTLSIYIAHEKRYQNVGTIELSTNKDPKGDQPITFGKIKIHPDWLGKFEIASVSAWTKEQREKKFNGANH